MKSLESIRTKIIFIGVITLLFVTGCKDEFLIEDVVYKPELVVDGFISNHEPPYTIKLSLSNPVNTKKVLPYENCIVTIFENNTNSEILSEVEPGIYTTSENGIKGTVNSSYHIKIENPDGEIYMTEPQVMKPPIEIDSIYAKLIYKKDISYPFGLPGYQFYITTKQAKETDNFILWSLIETYQYTSDFELYAYYDGRNLLYDELGEIPDEYKNVYRCWETQNTGQVFTGETGNLTIPKISDQPLHFVGTNSNRLQEKYSLLVNQFTIDGEAFEYWKAVEEQTDNDNFLVANQPYDIKGNVFNVNNINELVHGFFCVGSLSSKRIFLTRPNAAFYLSKCTPTEFELSYGNPLFIVLDLDGKRGKVLESCVNCTLHGGSIIKPEFWID